MVDHRYLTPDRTVQQSTFSNQIVVTVNFGKEPYKLPGGRVVKPMGYLVDGWSRPFAASRLERNRRSNGEVEAHFEIALPKAGRTWIGQPFDHDTLLSTCRIRNNTTGITRTAIEERTAASAWINWNPLWWN
jgi:hypothetical protein